MGQKDSFQMPYFHRSCPETRTVPVNISEERKPLSLWLSRTFGLASWKSHPGWFRVACYVRGQRNTPLSFEDTPSCYPLQLNSVQRKKLTFWSLIHTLKPVFPPIWKALNSQWICLPWLLGKHRGFFPSVSVSISLSCCPYGKQIWEPGIIAEEFKDLSGKIFQLQTTGSKICGSLLLMVIEESKVGTQQKLRTFFLKHAYARAHTQMVWGTWYSVLLPLWISDFLTCSPS